MAKVLLLYDKPSLLISSMKGILEENQHTVISCELAVNAVSKITDRQDVILIFADDNLSDNAEALVYVKDRMMELESGLFVSGSEEELESLAHYIPDSIVVGKFVRPINVKSVGAEIEAYLNDEKRTARKKILVVDDSGAMLRNVKGWLEDKYDVVLANSGTQAIRYLSLNTPDLLLLDYEMPVVDGKQVFEMMRSEVQFQDIPVIFLTSKADKKSVMDVMALRPEGYLLKTMSPDEIKKSVDDFFEKKRIEKLTR